VPPLLDDLFNKFIYLLKQNRQGGGNKNYKKAFKVWREEWKEGGNNGSEERVCVFGWARERQNSPSFPPTTPLNGGFRLLRGGKEEKK